MPDRGRRREVKIALARKLHRLPSAAEVTSALHAVPGVELSEQARRAGIRGRAKMVPGIVGRTLTGGPLAGLGPDPKLPTTHGAHSPEVEGKGEYTEVHAVELPGGKSIRAGDSAGSATEIRERWEPGLFAFGRYVREKFLDGRWVEVPEEPIQPMKPRVPPEDE